MSAFRPDLCRDRAADDLRELQCRPDRVDLPLSDDVLRDILCETVLTVIADNSIQLHLTVAVYDIRRGLVVSLIHSHIQWGILPIGESTVRRIQLVRRHTKIQINAIHLFNSKVKEHFPDILIVASDDRNFIFKWEKTFRCRRDRVRVLIDSDQAALFAESPGYFVCMSAAA